MTRLHKMEKPGCVLLLDTIHVKLLILCYLDRTTRVTTRFHEGLLDLFQHHICGEMLKRDASRYKSL